MVLDASFIVKLVLEEEGSDIARSLARSWMEEGKGLTTIDVALPETLNAIWRHALKIGDLNPNEAIDVARDFLRIWTTIRVYSSREVAEEALKLALEENIAVYDALYIQLARSLRASLATFDGKLSRIALKYGVPTYPSLERK